MHSIYKNRVKGYKDNWMRTSKLRHQEPDISKSFSWRMKIMNSGAIYDTPSSMMQQDALIYDTPSSMMQYDALIYDTPSRPQVENSPHCSFLSTFCTSLQKLVQ
jgi:hypothetical protein